ncbi:MAG TPA: NAD(P)/FAD-dependent oxidoreductase [Thermoanaerobaculia bacterium]|nr:NAD(P)/FAD-dependent oxidoreductase [Thermoanaerobaculia bacterium]
MEEVVIVGGGLVGSLLSLFLAARGYAVRVFERNPDPRTAGPSSGRSINLTLSHRGFAALSRAGVIDAVRAIAMPAYGRVIHGEDGGLAYQPYGIHREALFSITRSDLNRVLLDIAAQTPGIEIRFRQKCVGLDGSAPAVILEDLDSGQTSRERAGMIFGADGAFSAVRLQLQKTDRFDYSQEYIDQGYKELSVPPPAVQAWGLDPEALHIWPRGRYMLIGFANFDGSFTLALHLPYEGAPSFAAVRDESDLLRFFAHSFPDALPHIPNLVGDFFGRPVSSMLTVRCFPWVRGRVALLGDAAHAIVPSYGQGANAGFEDCAVLDGCLERHGGDWDAALADFERRRKPNADAIADLSLRHFREIRDEVREPRFLLRKAVERRLDELYPGRFTPLYSLVSFTGMSYVEALERAREQEVVVDRLLAVSDLEERLADANLGAALLQQVVGAAPGGRAGS